VSAAAAASADPLPPGPPPPPPPVESTTIQAAGDAPEPGPPVALPAPPDGVPHLASPDALPPGSTLDPTDNDSPNVSYLKDLWQAVQNHEISGKEARHEYPVPGSGAWPERADRAGRPRARSAAARPRSCTWTGACPAC
jgi:hypothetical protein